MSLPVAAALPAFAPSVTDLWALGGWAFVVAAALATLVVPPAAGAGRRRLLGALVLALLVSAVLPAAARLGDGLTWSAVVRGHAGDPSAVLVAVALWRLAGRLAGRRASTGPGAVAGSDRRWLLGLAMAVGWTLIATQLHADRVDPYRLGYAGTGVAIAAAGVALVAAVTGRARTATAIAAGLAAWGLGLTESTNLWDALVDPWLTVAATGWWVAAAWRRVRARTGRAVRA